MKALLITPDAQSIEAVEIAGMGDAHDLDRLLRNLIGPSDRLDKDKRFDHRVRRV